MFTVSIMTSPERADLMPSHVEALRDALAGGGIIWLADQIAAEFAVSEPPENAESLMQAARDMGFDVALQATPWRRKSLLLADMDSTIIEQECIDELAEFAGFGERVRDITARAMNGEIDFHEALVERVGLLAGLDLAVIDEVLSTRITLAPGAATLVATMRDQGAYTALVSGGFTAFTSEVARWVGFDEHRANTLLDENNVLTGHVALPVLGRQAKLDALQEILAAHDLVAAQAMAVGDGANDLLMLQAAGAGVALHAKPAVAAQAPYRIDHGDLTALLYLQGYGRDEFQERG